MISCPNKRLKIWKDLVTAVGEPKAYVIWAAKGGMVEDYIKPTQPSTQPAEVKPEVEELKNKIQELKSQLPTPTLSIPKVVDDKVLFELRAVNSMRASKRPQAEKKLIEKYGPERIARAKYIEEKFQDIVGKIIEKKINFFYDSESGKFERCP
jgi:hypothetical protein